MSHFVHSDPAQTRTNTSYVTRRRILTNLDETRFYVPPEVDALQIAEVYARIDECWSSYNIHSKPSTLLRNMLHLGNPPANAEEMREVVDRLWGLRENWALLRRSMTQSRLDHQQFARQDPKLIWEWAHYLWSVKILIWPYMIRPFGKKILYFPAACFNHDFNELFAAVRSDEADFRTAMALLPFFTARLGVVEAGDLTPEVVGDQPRHFERLQTTIARAPSVFKALLAVQLRLHGPERIKHGFGDFLPSVKKFDGTFEWRRKQMPQLEPWTELAWSFIKAGIVGRIVAYLAAAPSLVI